MKMFQSQLSKILKLLLAFMILTNNILFANSVDAVLFNSTVTTGPQVVKDNRLIITGDSFAGKFVEFEENKDFILTGSARAGRTIVDNSQIMLNSLNYEFKNVLVSIGVNDHFYETPPYKFEATLRSFLNQACFNNKKVYFHSYLNYFADTNPRKKYAIFVYDNIIRQLCLEYFNAQYIDVKDLENLYYISDDYIHYNKLFYDELFKRLKNLLIKEEENAKF